jgi:hypothetical protein
MRNTTRRKNLLTVIRWSNVPAVAILLAVSVCFAQSGSQSQAPAQDKPSGQNTTGGADKPAVQEPSDKGKKPDEQPMAKLKIEVTGNTGKPVAEASVYVRFSESGGLFHKDKLAEMNFKTNEDGTVKVPEVPQGKVLIQVVAKGWHTYGKWYDIEKEEETIQIKLEPPPHWY